MEQLIDLLPVILTTAIAVGGGVFALVRWLFSQEEARRKERELERDKIDKAKRETEEAIWVQANDTIDHLTEEVRQLRADNKLLRREMSELQAANRTLQEEIHILTKLLEDDAI